MMTLLSQRDIDGVYLFYCNVVLRLISSRIEKLNVFGWLRIIPLVSHAKRHHPPAQTIIVSKAGCNYMNGTYMFVGQADDDGCAEADSARYEMIAAANKLKAVGGRKPVIYPIKIPDNEYQWLFASEYTNGTVIHYVADSSNGNRPPEEVKNKVVERFYNEGRCCEPGLGAVCVNPFMKLLGRMRTLSTAKRSEYCLQPHHILHIWRLCICNGHKVTVDLLRQYFRSAR